MHSMVANGEIAALVPERVWREMERALGETTPEAFFDTLANCGSLGYLLPELKWDAEDRESLRAAAGISSDASVRFAALMAASGGEDLEVLCRRLRVPGRFSELAQLCARLQQRLAQAAKLDATDLLDLLDDADALRRPERFERLLESAAARGADGTSLTRLRAAVSAAAAVALPPEQMRSLAGPEIAAALRVARVARLASI
jgi:tRNA nucleotidyltransferase (CCA-adding enzyme)